MSLPGLTIKESVAPMFTTGNGGKTIAVIGSTGTDTEKGELNTFYNFNSAYTKYHQDEEKGYNPLLKSIYDIFKEAETREITQSLGINLIHAINTGKEPNKGDYTSIMETISKEGSIDIEAYINLSDVDILNSVKKHLELLASQGDYRIAIATAPKEAKIKDIKTMTTNEDSNVCSSRVVLHSNPGMVAAFTAKVACTPYFEDPSRGGYRSKTLKEVIHSRNEIEELLEAGVVCDWDSYDSMGRHVLEPCIAISTSHTTPPEGRPTDSVLHHRLNADHQAKVTDQYLRSFLKCNNSDIMRQSAESKCRSHLANEVRKGFLEDYTFHLTVDPANPSTLMVDMRVTPVSSIHHIVLNREIKAIGGRLNEI